MKNTIFDKKNEGLWSTKLKTALVIHITNIIMFFLYFIWGGKWDTLS